MNLRNLTLPIAALAVILTAGIVPGVMTNRWGQARDLAPIAEQLHSIPLAFGDWVATETEVPADQLERAEIEGYLSRTYIHRKSGESVNLLVVVGRPGPISVHTPDVCFRGAGYEPLAASQPYAQELTGSGRCEFSVCNFAVPSATLPQTVRVFWSWSSDGAWQAPENPRIAFAGKPFLLKLYAVRNMRMPDEKLNEDESMVLLKEFLPALRQAVFEQKVT